MFIDTHCHLYDEKFEDIDEIVKNAIKNGVKKMLVAGCDIDSCNKAIDLAEKYEEIYACVGIYPEFAENYDKNTEKTLKNMLKNSKVVAVGEIGLDYTYENVSREKQKEVLLKQLKLAKEFEKPVVLHGRDCYGELVSILKENKNLLDFKGTFHCFTGSRELAKEIIKLGFFISAGGVSTFENAKNVREMIKSVDLDYLILETDSPYLSPKPFRGKRNEPANIIYIARSLAELKGVELKEVEEKTTKNAKGLFRI